MSGTVRICRDPDDLAREAVRLILEVARDAIAQRGRFTIALSGGSTPERMHRLLAQPDNARQLDWQHVLIFMGDERFVPYEDPRSNYGMAQRTLLNHVPIPPGNLHPIPTALPSAEEAAVVYTATLKSVLVDPARSAALPPSLDLVLLGLGSDGHTASLFPGKPTVAVTDRLVVSSPPGVLPPPVDRVTFTFPMINAAHHVAFLIADAKKANLVRELLEGNPDPHVYPAAAVRPTHGQLLWLLDQATAGALTPK
jgi:6-phosphogluconolactonase